MIAFRAVEGIAPREKPEEINGSRASQPECWRALPHLSLHVEAPHRTDADI